MQRSFKVHFRLVVLGWLRKSEGCSIRLLRLREVLSRESNHLRRPHFFCPYPKVLRLAKLRFTHLGCASAKLPQTFDITSQCKITCRPFSLNKFDRLVGNSFSPSEQQMFLLFAFGLRSVEEIGRLQHTAAKTTGGALS